MKKILIAGVFATMILASCQKTQQDELFNQPAAFSNNASITRSGWVPVTLNGGATDSKGFTDFTGTVSEQAVSNEILAGGVVLLFAKQGENVVTLPATIGAAEWSYETSASSIGLRVSASENPGTSASVRYVVVPADKVSSLEAAGVTKNDLMNMSYDKATSLFQLP